MKVDQQKLYDGMAKKGILMKDLCSKVNMNERTMKKVLDNGSEIDAGTLLKISRVLAVDQKDLEKAQSRMVEK